MSSALQYATLKSCQVWMLTSATAGTQNVGTPLAKLPKPASEPHIASENSPSVLNSPFCSSLAALVDEKRFTKEFMMDKNEGYTGTKAYAA